MCAFALAAGALLCLEAYRTTADAYEREVAEVFQSVDRTAQLLATRTSEVFDRVDQSTLLVKYLREQAPQRTPLAALRQAGVIAHDVLDGLYVADRAGFVHDTTSATTAGNVADEDFFKLHRHGADRGLAIGQARTDPLSGRPGIPVTRRLEQGGEFAGVVAAVVKPTALSVPFARHEQADTVIGVIDDQGIYLSRALDRRLTFGERLDLPSWRERIRASRERLVPVPSTIDGTLRFVSIVPVDGYPLHAAVAVSAESALADYRGERSRIVGWTAAAMLALVCAVAALWGYAGRLDQSRERTRRAEAAFRATLDGSMDAVLVLAYGNRAAALPSLRIADCNEPAARLMQLPRARAQGRLLDELAPDLHRDLLGVFRDARLHGRPVQHEHLVESGPLQGRWLHHQVVPLEDGLALISRDITAWKTAEDRLKELARVDELTGVFNRRGFEEKLEEAMARARRSGASFALLYIDLDGFKAINDRHGHETGDRLLRSVAHRLRGALRLTDTVARIGGDEFTVILEGADAPEVVQALCERALALLSAPHDVGGDLPLRVTPSIGVSRYQPGDTPEALKQRADGAMYRAKSGGKARVEWSRPPGVDSGVG